MKAGVNAIIQKIHEDAEVFAREKLAVQTREIGRDFDKEMAVYRADLAKFRETLPKQKSHEMDVQLERKKSSLERERFNYQHKLVDEVFDMVVLELRNMPEQEFVRLFQAAVRGLSGRYDLFLGEYSKGKLRQSDVDKVAAENDNMKLRLRDELRPDKSGFMLINPNVEYSCFFEDLVNDYKGRQAAIVLMDVFADKDSD